ncbi:hypothetical protein TH25_14190 [Thalassospira profundimaris]|uniref:Uncharacterized protein n=1 Tax=Thalassospira profundimaris TaxID=502049 RepID=A0A367X7J1_9PROT|nr:hypothetical protein [Thalassospira profundimaris]RCK48731.1 hypothetical protein TH25_14190 [Thalassospira profundimaris]
MNISFAQAQQKLEEITAEMLVLIRQYGLDAESPFDVIAVARRKIDNQQDYVRFLELSLEGRIYGEYADALQKQMDRQASETDDPSNNIH